MKLISNNIELELLSGEDSIISQIVEDSDDLFNMSEVWLYPKGTPTQMIFAIKKDGKLIGELKLQNIRWFNRKAELSIILKKEEQSRGTGTEIVKKIIEYAFGKMNLHRLEAEVIETNSASIKLIEKFGFKKEGVLREAKFQNGKFIDIYRYGLLRSEYKKQGNEK